VIWVDYVLIAIVALSAVISLLRGFIREALALVGWVAAVWLVLTFTQPVAAMFAQHVEVPSLRMGIAALCIFVATLIVAAIVVYLVGLLVDKTGLSGTDRMLGVVFGAARGVIIAAIVVLLAGLTPLPRDPWWRDSLLLPRFQQVAEQMRTLLPEEIARSVDFSAAPAAATPLPAPVPSAPRPQVLNPPGSG
jgi:membrane protein required for colicin V production